MTNLMQKLSVLVKATLNDTSDVDHSVPGSGADVRSRLRRDLPELQRRLDDALAYEHTLARRIETLEGEIGELRAEQQSATRDGLPERARVISDAIRRAENRLTMTRSDLREHKASALQLEAAVFELEQILEQQVDEPASASRASAAMDTLTDFLRRARDRFMASADNPTAPPSEPPQSAAQAPAASDGQPPDDDMAQRLSRLSKR